MLIEVGKLNINANSGNYLMPIHDEIVDYRRDEKLISQLEHRWRWQDWPQKAHITYIDGNEPIILSGHEINDWDYAEYPSLTGFLENNELDNSIP